MRDQLMNICAKKQTKKLYQPDSTVLWTRGTKPKLFVHQKLNQLAALLCNNVETRYKIQRDFKKKSSLIFNAKYTTLQNLEGANMQIYAPC